MEALKLRFIHWMFSWPMFRREMYTKVFADAQKDILETMEDDLDKKANELADTKIAQLFSVVDAHKVVTLDKQRGIVFIGGEKADEGRLANLKAEANFLLNSDIWSVLYESPKALAHRAMFAEGEDLPKQLAKGRSMLYTLETQKNILDVFNGFIPKSK